MARHHLVALIWALVNMALASQVPLQPRAGWPLILVIGFFPTCFIFFADFIAANLFRGFIEQFARDRNEPQSPHAIMFFGWVMMAILTVVLLVKKSN